jgi:hypothetical protein
MMRYLIFIYLLFFFFSCEDTSDNKLEVFNPGYYLKIVFKHQKAKKTGELNQSFGKITYQIFDGESRNLLVSDVIDTNTIVLTDSAFMNSGKFIMNATFQDFNDIFFYEIESLKDTVFNKVNKYAEWEVSLKPITVSHQFKLLSPDTVPASFNSFDLVFDHRFFQNDTVDSLFFENNLTQLKTVNTGSYDLLLKLFFINGQTKDTVLLNQKIEKPLSGNVITELTNIFK